MTPISALVNQLVADEKHQKCIDRRLTKIDSHSLKPPNQECSICREPLQSKVTSIHDDCDWGTTTISEILRQQKQMVVPEIPVRLIRCGHIFGESCITRWLRTADTCPTCRLTALAPPIILIPELQDWRRQRGNMFQRTQDARWEKPSIRRHVLAQRVMDFIERETSYDEVPHRLMREVCVRLARSSESLVDGAIDAYVNRWERDDGESVDEMLRWLLEWQFFEEEVERVAMVVRVELAECATIMSACPGLRG